jgi:hypothetical protein
MGRLAETARWKRCVPGLAPMRLDRFTIAYTGAAPRVVYSRLFPDWTPDLTKPQTGRLNKSPHTVGAIANRRKASA